MTPPRLPVRPRTSVTVAYFFSSRPSIFEQKSFQSPARIDVVKGLLCNLFSVVVVVGESYCVCVGGGWVGFGFGVERGREESVGELRQIIIFCCGGMGERGPDRERVAHVLRTRRCHSVSRDARATRGVQIICFYEQREQRRVQTRTSREQKNKKQFFRGAVNFISRACRRNKTSYRRAEGI